MMAHKKRQHPAILSALLDLPLTGKLLFGLLGLAGVLGGADQSSAIFHALVQIAAIGMLGFIAVARPDLARGTGTRIVLALMVLVPLLQLVPLPPQIWTALPGRAFAGQIADAVAPGAWYPLTLDSVATQRWLIALSVPVASFLLARGMGSAGRASREGIAVLWCIVAVGSASGLLGLAQLATGSLHLHLSNHNNFPVGFFTNRNHQADAMALTLCVTLLLAVRKLRQGRLEALLWPYVPIALLTITVAMLTQSRAGIALLALSIVPAFIMLRHTVTRRSVFACLAVIVVLGGWVLLSGSGQSLLARMGRISTDERFTTLGDVWFLVTYNFPFGTGLGSFVVAFLPVESLTSVSQFYLNHAHCEYLEVLAEAGLIGGVAILCVVGWWLFTLLRILHLPSASDEALVKLAAVSILGLLLVHSLADYPVRSFTILAIAAACVGLLTDTGNPEAADPTVAGRAISKARIGPVSVVVLVLLALGTVQLGRITLNLIPVMRDGKLRAYGAPVTTTAFALEAQAMFERGEDGPAVRNATRALQVSTYNSLALQILGESALSHGDSAKGREFLALAARVTWRNADVQMWQVRQAMADGDYARAVDAADALLRRRDRQVEVLPILAYMAITPEARAPLVTRFAENPPWAADLRTVLLAAPQETFPQIDAFLLAALQRGYRPNSDSWSPLFDAALKQGRGSAIVDMARLTNPGTPINPAEGVVDSRFDLIGASRTLWGPFGWTLRGSNAYFDGEDRVGDEHTLSIDRSRGGVVLAQPLILRPGRYQLTGHANWASSASGLASWNVACRNRGAKPTMAQIQDGRNASFTVQFSVPQNCPVQDLSLNVMLDAAKGTIVLHDINIARVSGPDVAE